MPCLSSVLAVLAVALVLVVAAPAWRLTWRDEFEGTALNASQWRVRHNQSHCCGPFGGEELELYLAEQVSVAGGHLRLQTQRRPTVGPRRGGGSKVFEYVSGWVDTKGLFGHQEGRFAANCSLPPRNATGIWPAFWLLPSSGQCWPTGGEVDVFEMNGDPLQDRVWGSYHWADPGQCGKDREPIPGRGTKPPGAASDWQLGWHVYAVEWFADRLDFYLDDTLYLTRTRDQVDLPTGPLYLIFDQAVDQTLFPPSPSTPAYDGDGVSLLVDWVRVYERGASLIGH